MATTARARIDARPGHRFLLACLLGFALLLAHQLLMATPRHAAEMGLAHPRGMAALPMAQPAAGVLVGDLPAGPLPPANWEACLAQAGLLPALLLLLVLAGLARRLWGGGAVPTGRHADRPRRRFLHPPPLEPARRRALLQVFRN